MLTYSIGRNQERESLFKWVGTIASIQISLFKLKSRTDIQITTLEDLKEYRVGGMSESHDTQYLASKGISVESVTRISQNINKLKANRVDLIVGSQLMMLNEIKLIGYDLNEFEKTYFIEELSTSLYVAFSRHTPDSLVETFRTALEEIKTSGRYDAIRRTYLK